MPYVPLDDVGVKERSADSRALSRQRMSVELDGDPAVIVDLLQRRQDPVQILRAFAKRQELPIPVILQVDILDAIRVRADECRRVAARRLQMRRIGTEVDAGVLENLRDLRRRLHDRAEMRMVVRHQTRSPPDFDDPLEPRSQPAIVLLLNAARSYGATADDEMLGAELCGQVRRLLDLAQLILQNLLVDEVRAGVDRDELQLRALHQRTEVR